MAYPTVAGFGSGSGNGSSGNSSIDLTVAGTAAVGDLIVVIFGTAIGNINYGGSVFPSKWGYSNQGGGAFSDYVATIFGWKIVEPGDPSTITVKTGSGSEPAVWQVYRIAAGTHDGVYPVGGTPIRYGTTTTPTGPTCTPFWPQGDTLWLAWAAFWNTTELSISSYPTNYTDGTLNTRLYTSLGYIHLATCRRQLNATSDTAGTFTISGAPVQSFTQRLAIAPARNVTAYPKVIGVGYGNSGGNVTNTDIAFKYAQNDDTFNGNITGLNPQPGDLVVVAVCKDGTGTFTWPATPAFTSLTNAAFQSVAAFTVGYRIWQTGDSYFVSLSHANESSGFVAFVIEKDTFASGTAPQLAETNGSSTNPDPPSLNPSSWDVENTLWLALAGNDGNQAITAAPSGFYGLVNGRVAASTGAGCAGAWLGEATAAKDPAAFTMSTEQWYAGTVGVRPTHAWVKSLFESPVLTDATVTTEKGEAGGSKTLTDTATLTATPTKGPGKNATETATLTGTVSKAVGIALLELLTLTDPTVTTSKASSYTKELTETVTLADTRERAITRTLTESITATDTVSRTSNWQHATKYQSGNGGIVSGALSDTWHDDATSFVLSEVSNTPGFEHIFRFGPYDISTAASVPTSNLLLTLVGQYSGNAGHTVQVQQWDFVTGGGQWVDTGGRVTDSGSTTTYRFYLSTDAKYLSGGKVYVQFYHSSPGNPTHQLIINELFLSYRFDGTESATLTDTLTAKKGTIQGTETLSLADSLTKAANYQRTLTEGVSLTDTWTKASAAARTLEEQLYANDLELLQASITLYESASLADSPKKDWARTLTEGLTLSDTLSAALRNVTLTETLGLADTASKGPARTWTEGATLTATPTKGPGRTLSDAATVADGTLKRTAQGIRNDITLADSMGSRPVTRTLTETAVLTDSVQNEWSGGANNYTKDLTENLLLSDVFDRTWTAARSYTEAATLADSATKGPGRTLSEGVTLSDSLVRLATAQRTLEEQLWANDLELLQASITLKETLGLAATFERQAGRSRTITNYLYLSDAGLRVSDVVRQQVGGLWSGFESGDFAGSGWTETDPDGNMAVDSSNPHSGAYSAHIDFSSSGADAELERVGIGSLPDCRVSFWIYIPSTATDPDASCWLYDSDYNRFGIIYWGIKAGGGQVRVNARAYLDGGTFASTSEYNFALDAWHKVEVRFKTSTAPGANNGTLELLVNDVSKETLSGLDNDYVAFLDILHFYLGYQSGAEHYLDDVVAYSDTTGVWLADGSRRDTARTLAETLSLADSINNVYTPGTTGYTKDLTETAVLADTATKDTSRMLVETATLSDTRTGAFSRDLTETLVLSDAATKQTERTAVEALVLTGTLTQQGGAVRSETSALVATPSKQTSRTLLVSDPTWFPPDGPANLVAWFRPEGITVDGNGYVTGWTDESGAANHMVAVGGASSGIVLSTANGYPAVAFSGGSQQLRLTSEITDIRTVIVVLRSDEAGAPRYASILGSSGPYRQFCGGNGSPGTIYDTTYSANAVRNGTTWYNGVVVTPTATARPLTTTVLATVTTANARADAIGAVYNYPSAGGSWVGRYSEILIYDRALTSAEALYIQQQLIRKYEIDLGEVYDPALDLTDTVTNQVQLARSYTETLGLADSVTVSETKQLPEVVGLADTASKDTARELADTAALSDTFSRQVNYQRTFTETAGLLDSLSQGNSETFLNGVALTDTLTLQSDRYRTFTETATLADTIQKATGRTATELLTLTDSRGVSSLARTHSEQVTLTDQASKHSARSINEIAYLTDSLDVSIGAAKVESLALTDSVRKDIARTLVETAGLVDLVNTGNSQTFLAGVTLADTVSKSASRTLTEGLTLLDIKVSGDQIDFEDPVSLTATVRKDTGRALAEVVGLTDSLTTQANFSQIQSDVVVLSDTLETQFSGANHYTKELTEAATLIDTVSKAASRSLIEGVTLSDSHREDAARIHAEGLGLADTLTVESAGARLLTDRVTLSDSLTTQRRAINLLEQVVLGDVLQANRFVSKTLTEKITLRHNPNSFGTSQPPNKGVGRTLAEGITVKDSWVHHKYETLVLTDTLERLRTHVLYQTPTLIDTLEVGYGDSSSQEDVVLVDEVRKDVARELTEGITVRTAALAPDIYTEEQVLMFAG